MKIVVPSLHLKILRRSQTLKSRKFEAVYDFEPLVQEAFEQIETLTITPDYQSEKDTETQALADHLF